MRPRRANASRHSIGNGGLVKVPRSSSAGKWYPVGGPGAECEAKTLLGQMDGPPWGEHTRDCMASTVGLPVACEQYWFMAVASCKNRG